MTDESGISRNAVRAFLGEFLYLRVGAILCASRARDTGVSGPVSLLPFPHAVGTRMLSQHSGERMSSCRLGQTQEIPTGFGRVRSLWDSTSAGPVSKAAPRGGRGATDALRLDTIDGGARCDVVRPLHRRRRGKMLLGVSIRCGPARREGRDGRFAPASTRTAGVLPRGVGRHPLDSVGRAAVR